MAWIFNRADAKGTRKRLRREMPRAEVLLWARLRSRQLADLKFRRQYSIGAYVVDFYCAGARLAIEVDGDSHFGDGAEPRDARRQKYIESFGIRFVRPTNDDVVNNIEGVLEEIERVGLERLRMEDPPQSPLGKGGS